MFQDTIWGYPTSNDYPKLAELMKEQSVICFVDYKNSDGQTTILTDICKTGEIRKQDGEDVYFVYSRKTTYILSFGIDQFIKECQEVNLVFIDPTTTFSTNCVLEQMGSFEHEDGSVTVGVKCDHRLLEVFASNFAALIIEHQVANYVEVKFRSPRLLEDEQIVVTVQKVSGKSPHELKEQEVGRYKSVLDKLTGYFAAIDCDPPICEPIEGFAQRPEDLIRCMNEFVARFNTKVEAEK